MAKSKYNVKVGDKFGHWTVLEVLGQGGECLCECDCENKTHRVIDTCMLYKGHTKSCGCSYKHQIKIGDIYSDNLEVIHKSKHKTKDGRTLYTCKCLNCGNEIDVLPKELVNGHVKSCGCYTYSRNGDSKHPLYETWIGIINRCYNKNVPHYKDYGGRGITVCPNWKDSFDAFKLDLYESYLNHVEEYGEDNTSLDRIDVNGNYELANVRWATNEEQSLNKRNTWYITYKGETKTAKEWANTLGLKYDTVRNRKYRHKINEPERLLAPVHKIPKGDKHNYGETNKK